MSKKRKRRDWKFGADVGGLDGLIAERQAELEEFAQRPMPRPTWCFDPHLVARYVRSERGENGLDLIKKGLGVIARKVIPGKCAQNNRSKAVKVLVRVRHGRDDLDDQKAEGDLKRCDARGCVAVHGGLSIVIDIDIAGAK